VNQRSVTSQVGPKKSRAKPSPAQYEALALVRLSKHFIMRDMLFSTESAARGFTNYPEDPAMVIRAGKALCETLLEPIRQHWGHFFITFGYQSREGIEYGWSAAKREANVHSSNPHQLDRKTWGDAVYARCDILPMCVEDGDVSKTEFGHWLMHHLDLDLCMTWTRSNVFCLTISPLPRRVWLEWGNPLIGEPKQRTIMGTHYWQNVYPTLPEHARPKFRPSATGGRMQWRHRDTLPKSELDIHFYSLFQKHGEVT
jgi:hypothetical protein